MSVSAAIVGLIVGLFVGLSGMGGGALLTPLLILAFGVNPLAAVGSDLVSSVPMKLVGAIAHFRQKTVDVRLVLLLSGGGVPGAIVGLAVLGRIQAVLGAHELDVIVGRTLGVALILAAIALAAGMIVRRNEAVDAGETIPTPRLSVIVPAIGFIVGIVVSMTSVGSGSLTLPLLFLIVPQLGLRRLIGSDVAFAAILIPVAAAGHWRLGNVNVPLVLSLLVGSVPGVLIGSRLCAVVPTRYFRPVLAGAMVFIGVRLF
jgi:uncharacterized membrane protein YfcA